MSRIVYNDLFSGEVQDAPEDTDVGHESAYQAFKRRNNYRLAGDKAVCCKTCANLRGISFHDKNYYKCRLIGCSASPATDIRLRDVCDRWERE